MSLSSAHAFIRALKAQSDPPLPSGERKIELAHQAWSTPSLYIPSKAEVIVDWLLSQLLKNADPDQPPSLDIRYWTLLDDILRHDTDSSKPSRTWLLPILNRIPAISILTSFLLQISAQSGLVTSTLLHIVTRCYAIIWPLAVPRANHDAVIDCFWALLSVVASPRDEAMSLDISNLTTMISDQFSRSFSASPSKRKICVTFVTGDHFRNWLYTGQYAPLPVQEIVYTAISTLLFSVEGIRHLILIPNSSEESIFLKLSGLEPVSTFAEACVPRLFASFWQAVRKHRAVLFAEGSTNSHASSADDACVAFFRSCITYVGGRYDEQEKWHAFSNLVDAVRTGALYSRGSAWRSELAALGLQAAVAVDASSNDPALALLTDLMRLDYDIISDLCPDVYTKLFFSSHVPGDTAQDFTTRALDYARKTRTVDDHLIAISTCFQGKQNDPQVAYERACRNVFFSHNWRSQVHSSVALFLSPSQASRLASDLMKIVANEWEKVHIHLQTTVKQQTKSEHRHSVAAYALLLSYATDILCALFDRSAGSSGPSFNEYLLRIVEMFDAIDATLSSVWNSRKTVLWEHYALQSCALRCRYALSNVWDSSDTSLPPVFGDLYNADVASHELRFELDRTLLRLLPKIGTQAVPYVATLLVRLEQNLVPRHEWDGSVCISSTSADGQHTWATAIWSSILLRWLPTLNAYVDQDHLQHLVALMVRVYESRETGISEQYTAITLLNTALTNASTWELHSVGAAIVTQILKETEGLTIIDLSKGAKRILSKKKHRPSDDDFNDAIRAFKFAQEVPPAVLSKASREELLRRAFAADILCATAWDRSHVRKFIARHGSKTLPALPADIIVRFIDAHNDIEYGLVDAIDATFDIATTLFARSVGDVSKECADALAAHFVNAIEHAEQRSHLYVDEQLLGRYIQQVSRLPASDASIDSLLRAVNAYIDSVSRGLQGSRADNSFEIVHSVTLAAAARRASRALNIKLSQTRGFVPTILPSVCNMLQNVTPSTQAAALALCAQLLVLMINDLQHATSTDSTTIIIAAFAIFKKFLTEADDLDPILGDAIKELPVASYDSLLGELRQSLLTLPQDRHSDICATIHLSALLCCNVPEGASKLARDQTRTCMTVFANSALAQHAEPSIRLEVLRFAESIARDRPMSLQVQDIGQIWILLSQTLSPSSSHDSSTSPDHFHSAVSTAMSLLRLRRDLAAPTLPHLAHILRLLIGALVAPRPQLGAKQLREVCDELPRFIAARADGTGTLGAHEARTLARLMTALTTKTTVVGRTDDRAATSLARPFARHAPGVLLAYVKTASAPLSVLPLAVRRELEPGVFALCAMSGEHGRDSVMAGSAGAVLDATGKAVFRTIWQEYEKQKYAGTG